MLILVALKSKRVEILAHLHCRAFAWPIAAVRIGTPRRPALTMLFENQGSASGWAAKW